MMMICKKDELGLRQIAYLWLGGMHVTEPPPPLGHAGSMRLKNPKI